LFNDNRHCCRRTCGSIGLALLPKVGESIGNPRIPTVLMNYNQPTAESLAAKILNRHVTSKHCFAGLNFKRDVFEVVAHVVVPIPRNSSITNGTIIVPGPCVCLIGASAHVQANGVEEFMTCYRTVGRVSLAIGFQIGPEFKLDHVVFPDIWSVQLPGLLGPEVNDHVTRAITQTRIAISPDIN
jgi:hypothetical protein